MPAGSPQAWASVLAMLLLGATGCGAASEHDRALATARAFMVASRAGDGARVCALLTPASHRAVARRAHMAAMRFEVQPDASSCVEYNSEATPQWNPTPTVRVTGRRALATFKPQRDPGSGYLPDHNLPVRLVLTAPGWRVDDGSSTMYPRLPAGERACVASWNRAVTRHALPSPPGRGATAGSDLWASFEAPAPGYPACRLSVNTPAHQFLYAAERDGRWRRSVTLPRGLATRNVWMSTGSTVVTLQRHDPG